MSPTRPVRTKALKPQEAVQRGEVISSLTLNCSIHNNWHFCLVTCP